MPECIKEKIRQKLKGRKFDDIRKANISNALMGRKLPLKYLI
jgi:hypothetical protein